MAKYLNYTGSINVYEFLPRHTPVFLCGSRAVLGEACPDSSDWDFVAIIVENDIIHVRGKLAEGGWSDESAEAGYESPSHFESWRKDNVNLILTTSQHVFDATVISTEIGRAFNLTRREDRIAVHQIVRDGRTSRDVRGTTDVGALLSRVIGI